MRVILLAGLALAVSACGGGNDSTANEANAMIEDNLMLDNTMMMDPAMNGMTNMAGDMNTQNIMMQDATSNDADTNLANGL